MRYLTEYGIDVAPYRTTHYTIGDNGLPLYLYGPTWVLSQGLEVRKFPEEARDD
jgi:hypothetical protein